MSRLGVVVGLPQEAAILKQVLGTSAPPIRCAGSSPARAAEAARELISEGADVLISFGFAGGVSSRWNPGDVVVAGMVVAPDGKEYWPDLEISLSISGALGRGGLEPRPGTIVGVDHVIATADEKRALAAKHHDAAIDMESHEVAKAAQRRRFAVLRVIVDPADRTIPASVLRALDDQGRIRPLVLVGALLRAPADIPALLPLGRDHAVARKSLRRAAGALAGLT